MIRIRSVSEYKTYDKNCLYITSENKAYFYNGEQYLSTQLVTQNIIDDFELYVNESGYMYATVDISSLLLLDQILREDYDTSFVDITGKELYDIYVCHPKFVDINELIPLGVITFEFRYYGGVNRITLVYAPHAIIAAVKENDEFKIEEIASA